jgi:hypothetical protein
MSASSESRGRPLRFGTGSGISPWADWRESGGLKLLDLPLQLQDLKLELLSSRLLEFDDGNEAVEVVYCDQS